MLCVVVLVVVFMDKHTLKACARHLSSLYIYVYVCVLLNV